MIVESAFLKILEILLSNKSQDLLYEANITNLITNAVILELNARNIDNPLMKIDMERRFNEVENIRCDIYLDFSSFMDESVFKGYRIGLKNWLEVKYFGGIKRNSGNETKSENAGSMIFDIFRTIYYTHINNNSADSKYTLNVFSSIPSSYLAFKRKDGSQREWVTGLTKSGIHDIKFELSKEPNTIKKLFSSFHDVTMEVKVRNTIFEPISVDNTKGSAFHGYLNQVIDYTISVDGKKYGSMRTAETL